MGVRSDDLSNGDMECEGNGESGKAMLDADDLDPHQEEELRCGLGSCRPGWLQSCANMKAFTFTLSMWSLFGSVNFTYYTAVITQIEREFGLPSSVSGFLKNVDNLGFMATVLIFSHFCRDANKPRLFSIATLVSSSAIFLFAVPHFLYGTSQMDLDTSRPAMPPRGPPPGMGPFGRGGPPPGPPPPMSPNSSAFPGIREELCDGRSEEIGAQVCGRGPMQSLNSAALGIFVLSMILQGIAQSPKFSLTLTYMDDNARDNSPKHFSFIFALRSFSPVVGFMLGAWATSVYVDLTDPGFDHRDPRWVGAWWLGFVICALCSVVWALPMVLFPPVLRRPKATPRPPKQQETVANKAKDLPRALCRVLTNKLYMLLLVGLCFETYQMGYFVFLPKYLEQYYGLTSSMASIIAGTVGALAWAIGPLVGGRIMTMRKAMTPFCATLLVWCISVFTLVCYFILFAMPCEEDRWAGDINVDRPDLRLECNGNCSCESVMLNPVCGDGINYYSPCHAGCTASTMDNGTTVYTGCQCIPDGIATAGMCAKKCNTLIPYALILAACMFVAGMDKVPTMTIFMRTVEYKDKALAIGVASAFLQIMSFPAPILFGLVIDTTCMVLRSPCARGRPGACALYNSETLRFRLHGFVLVTKGVAFLLYSLALFVSRKASFSVEDNKSLQAADKDADINHNKETELKLMGKTDSSEMAANS